MHRWFVFTRILVQNEPIPNQVLLTLAYGLHPLLLVGLVVCAIHHPWPLAIVLLARSATIALVNRRLIGFWRHSPLASIAAELLQPFFCIGAFLFPIIWWRRRRIRVRNLSQFEYLSP